jgi:uncharacterized protein YdaU (DUF1376 family)
VNYYPFHVGDYAAHTSHLEPMEDLAYRRMLDLYYLRECALPQEPAEVARLIRMRANVAEVEAVLREFFTNNDGDSWIHARCEAELSRMQDKQAKAKASALASVNARIAKQTSERAATVERTLSERSADVELPTPTPTPTPETKAARKRVPHPPCPGDVEPQTWDDWLALRKAKRAPVTETVIAEARREAIKAHISFEDFLRAWCRRGSQGLEADWLKPHERGSPAPISRFIKGTSLDPDFQGYEEHASAQLR